MGEVASLALFTGGIGWQEILLIMVVLLIFFGRRIPEVMRSLGKGVSQFKKGLSEVENEVRSVAAEASVETPEAESGKGAARLPPGPHPDADVASQRASGDGAEVKAGSEVEPEKDPEELAG